MANREQITENNKQTKKMQTTLLFERRFELEFDNIESIEQVEALLRKVIVLPFEITNLEIDTSKKGADMLHFSMQTPHKSLKQVKRNTILLCEAHLANGHLIMSGRSGFVALPLDEIIIFMIIFPLMIFLLYSFTVGGIGCASVALFIGAGIVASPLISGIDLKRRIERVFTDATEK